MPQLDILIFKYENFNFILSFFFLFFFNQYYVFPILLKNIVIRRKLITRKVDNTNQLYFSIIFLKKFSFNSIDNILFKVNVSTLSNLIMGFVSIINLFVSFFCSFKLRIFLYYLNMFQNKSNLVLWFILNGLYGVN